MNSPGTASRKVSEHSHTPRRPSMVEVARRAGVSHQTVSRVFNAPETVKQSTRDKVLRVVEELGYRRNLAARMLVTQQSQLLGIVFAGHGFHGPSAALAQVERSARTAGWSALVSAVAESDDVSQVVTGFAERGVEAVVVVAPRLDVVNQLRPAASAVPTVVLGDTSASDLRVVAVDQLAGAQALTQHVIDAGAREIVHLAGPQDWFDARSRLRGWRTTMHDAGLDPSRVVVGDWSGMAGYRCGQQLLAGTLPDAVVCGNDAMALGLIRALSEAGVVVGSDVLVTGFDDVEAAAWTTPSLTTVKQPFEALGIRCMESVLAAVAGQDPETVKIDPIVKIRESA